MILRTTMVLLWFGASASFAENNEREPAMEPGRVLAERMCSQCHSIGRSGQSPHADAPPFRQLARRLDLDLFSDRLREALTVEHPDMPAFRFTWSDARALVLYLRSIQAP